MPDILAIISPLFILIACGYLAVSRNLVDKAAIPGLGRFVMYFALPALIITKVGSSNITQEVDAWFVVTYGLGSLATYLVAFIVFKGLLKDKLLGAGIKSLGSSFSNSGFVGFPLFLLFFDNPPIAAFALILVFENVIMMPLVLSMLEFGAREDNSHPLKTAQQVIARLATNPIIIAIAISLPPSLLNISLPTFAESSLNILSQASAGAALFFIGGAVANNSITSGYRDITLVSIFKLIMHPTLVAIAIWLAPPFDPQLQAAALLLASVPMLSIYPIIGARFGFAGFCSSTILLCTVISFFTITALLAVIEL